MYDSLFSLSQWLAHQKTCPQCREKCLIRNVIKLFIDTNELSRCSLEDITPQEMKVCVHFNNELNSKNQTFKKFCWGVQNKFKHLRYISLAVISFVLRLSSSSSLECIAVLVHIGKSVEIHEN